MHPSSQAPICVQLTLNAVTGIRQGSVLMLRPGATTLEIAAKDLLLAGADGVAFGDKTTIYVNSVTAGKLLRMQIGPDGKAKSVVELKLPRPLVRPDCIRTIGKQRLLLDENSGTMSVVTIEGPEMQTVVLLTLNEGLEATPAVTAAKGIAWIVEGKLNYRNDPALKDKDAGTFKMYAMPLPKH